MQGCSLGVGRKGVGGFALWLWVKAVGTHPPLHRVLQALQVSKVSWVLQGTGLCLGGSRSSVETGNKRNESGEELREAF